MAICFQCYLLCSHPNGSVVCIYIHTVHSHCQVFCLHLRILRNARSILHIILYIHFHVSIAIDLMFSPNVRTITARSVLLLCSEAPLHVV